MENEKFYKSMFYIGYRPFIGWIVAVALIVIFPIQLLTIIVCAVLGIEINIPTDNMNQLALPIVGLASAIIGARSYEKVKGVDDEYSDKRT